MALGIWNVTRVHRWPLEQGGTAQDGGGGVWRGIFNHSGLGQACGGGLLVLSTQLGGVAVYSNLGSILPLSGEFLSLVSQHPTKCPPIHPCTWFLERSAR